MPLDTNHKLLTNNKLTHRGGVVFHTPTICHHTIGVFVELAKQMPVVAVTKHLEFRNLGKIDTGNVKIVKAETASDVEDVLKKYPDWMHFTWGGMRKWPAAEWVVYACDKLIERKIPHMVIFMEPYPCRREDGIKGFLRRLKWFWLLNVSSYRKIRYIGCTGKNAIMAYRKALVNKNRLFETIYAPIEAECEELITENSEIKFLYVGRLDANKSIAELCSEFSKINNENITLTIIGEGDDPIKQRVKGFAEKDKRINYVGPKSREEVAREYCRHDVLVLPSKYDGWGCVVNEAIAKGMRCIVSDGCGAQSLISDHPMLGSWFTRENWSELSERLKEEIERGPLTLKQKREIRNWAKCISAESVADYISKIIDSYFKNEKIPQASWLK